MISELADAGLTDEPLIGESLANGADIVTFSGDKLLGGPQAGIIVGEGEIVDRLRRDPLYRALRVDKLTYAAMEATLETFQRDAGTAEIPTLKMLAETKASVEHRAAIVS